LKQVSLDSTASNLGLASTASASEMLDPGRPIQARPSPVNDPVDGSQWILFGTGRYFEGDDKLSTAQQGYFGLKVPSSGTASVFIDVTDIDTEASGAISKDGNPVVVGGGALGELGAVSGVLGGLGGVLGGVVGDLGLLPSVIETFGELRNYIRNNTDGWYYNFDIPAGQGAERNITDTVFFGSVALFTTYQPDGEICDANGEGFLYGLDAFTGIAPPFGPLNFDSNTNYANKVVSLGAGRPAAPQIVRSAEGSKAIIQGSDGEVHEVELTSSGGARGRKTWLEIEIEADGSLFD
jgi:type IV pilus assembly protein PilY1